MCDRTYQCHHFWSPHTPNEPYKPCQGKFSLLASVIAVPFSKLRVMDSGPHQRSKRMEEVLIGSVMFSSVLQIQTFCDTEVMLHRKHKNYAPISGRLCVLWWYLASALARFWYIQIICMEVYKQCGEAMWATAATLWVTLPEWRFLSRRS